MRLSVLFTALCATSLVKAFPQQTRPPFQYEKQKPHPDPTPVSKSAAADMEAEVKAEALLPTSNAGGRTISGSGLKPAYSGGRYVGGAAVPYTAGDRSPSRSESPYLISGSALGAYSYWPRPWFYGIYFYPYPILYNHTYTNGSIIPANITCLCQEYQVCGCDPGYNATFVNGIINNGTDEPVNSSTVLYATFPNGTQAAFINGSLPNGTTAGGGTDPSNASEISGCGRIVRVCGGYVVMAAAMVGAVMI